MLKNWQTKALFATAYAGWAYTLWTATFDISTIMTLTGCTVMLFTPMHEAAHKNIEDPVANEVVGYLSATAFMGPFNIFRKSHITHHKYLNTEEDPDAWSGMSYPLLRMATQDLYYYWWYLHKLHKSNPTEIFIMTLCILPHMVMTYLYPCWVLKYLFLPSRLASIILAYTFDYLPHRPHNTTDKWKATHVVTLWGEHAWPLTIPFLCQNYHVIHHHYPYIPFYNYPKKWESMKEKFIQNGTRYSPIFGLHHTIKGHIKPSTT